MGRIGGFALFDVGSTVLASYLISRYMEWSFPTTLATLWLTGEGFHLLFKVSTPVTKSFTSGQSPSKLLTDEKEKILLE